MSVLIKGLEMPKDCISCPFCEHGTIDEWTLYCKFNLFLGNWEDKNINNGWRHEDCPLIELPPADVEPVKCEDCKTIIALKAALEPVKTGKWIYEHGYYCSECGDFWAEDDREMIKVFNYCPNCGAKMREEE